jgi:NADH-quinone oxidoreductase subunit L
MWLPMVLLAVGSVASGFIFTHGNSLKNWLAPVVEQSPVHEGELLKPAVVSVLALVLVILGVGLAVLKYVRKDIPLVAPSDVSIFTRIARRDLLQDDFNEAVFMKTGQGITRALVVTDKSIVDGAVRGVARLVRGSGSALRLTQTGFVRSYAMWILVGAIGLVAAIWVVTL